MAHSGVTLFTVIQNVGLTANLEVALDAGDATSYTSGQSWKDLSGNGIDFFRGTDGTAEASDPTFNGSPGKLTLNEYWSFDGGDQFRYDSANETWMQNMHKNSALFTLLTFVYLGSTSNQGIMGTGTGSADVGIEYRTKAAEEQELRIFAGGSTSITKRTDAAVSTGAFHMLALSIDEATGAGGGFFYKDGAYDQVGAADTFDATYTAPSAASATYTLELGSRGNTSQNLTSGSRMACFAAWEGTALTKANLDDIWSRMRDRFSI